MRETSCVEFFSNTSTYLFDSGISLLTQTSCLRSASNYPASVGRTNNAHISCGVVELLYLVMLPGPPLIVK